MVPLDPESAPSLEKLCGDSLQGTPANSSLMKDPPKQPIAKDLPAGASAKVRAKPVSDRRQRQLAAWAAAIEDRTDAEAFLVGTTMHEPSPLYRLSAATDLNYSFN